MDLIVHQATTSQRNQTEMNDGGWESVLIIQIIGKYNYILILGAIRIIVFRAMPKMV